jgi:hypothetical protein
MTPVPLIVFLTVFVLLVIVIIYYARTETIQEKIQDKIDEFIKENNKQEEETKPIYEEPVKTCNWDNEYCLNEAVVKEEYRKRKWDHEPEVILHVTRTYLRKYGAEPMIHHLLMNPYAFTLTVRIIENGPPGYEFGAGDVKGTDLATQCASCISTLIKDTIRWHTDTLAIPGKKRADYKDFLDYFANKYAPIGANNDPNNLNRNWQPNFLLYYPRLNTAKYYEIRRA